MAGIVAGCCRFSLAVGVVPLAVIIAVMLETPHVRELPMPEGLQAATASDATDGAAPGNVPGGAAPEEAAAEEAPKMGSGAMFDRIAFAYDSTNKWMSLGLDQFWRKTLIKECMRLERGDRVLDLATGTADVGLLAANLLKELGEGTDLADSVLGVDPSSEMLRRGVAKVEDRGFKGVMRLVKGDAQNLTEVRGIDKEGTLAAPSAGVASGSIDKISMSFGIRNVPDRARAFREMRRALRGRASSRVCILEFSLPDGSTFLSRVAKAFITHVVPAIGKVATLGSGGDEYQYLERSILEFPQPVDFAASMAREGLPVRSITSFAFGAVHLYAAAPAVTNA
mmetsp:Transcript_42407/g.95710  ORF Transcript_42407/g.95710 Transcript_42407/m.95710 type:complete len:339 (-) Transcript_42407:152-1168(-)